MHPGRSIGIEFFEPHSWDSTINTSEKNSVPKLIYRSKKECNYTLFFGPFSGTVSPVRGMPSFFSSFRFVLFTLCITFLSAFSASFFSVFRRNQAFLAALIRAFSLRISSCRAFFVFFGSAAEVGDTMVMFFQGGVFGIVVIGLEFLIHFRFRQYDSFRLP